MDREGESDIIPINENQINKIKIAKIKLFPTKPYFIKNNNPSSISTKNTNIKYNYYSIIINNIKKYNFNKEKYNLRIIDNIIFHKQSHFISVLKDKIIYLYINEFLKRYYLQKEINKKFGKIYSYYKIYLKFFLKPTLTDLYFCDIIRKNANKQVNYFYDKYNNKIINKEKNNNNNKNNKDYKSLFTKTQKIEIQNVHNNDNGINIENMNNKEQENNNNSSTIIFSYESLNNSKNNNVVNFEDTSNSLLSIANLINENKIYCINNKKKCKKDKINLILNYDDRTITQRSSTALTSTRSKKCETMKEKEKEKANNYSKNNNYIKYIINYNKIINDKNKNKNLLKNKNKNIFLFRNTKKNINDNKCFSKEEKHKEILLVTKKNNLNINGISTNISVKSKNIFNRNIFINNNNNINSCRNRPPSNQLKLNYYQTTQITNNKPKYTLNNISNLKKTHNMNEIINTDFNTKKYNNNQKQTNFKDYCIFTTQITKIQKKTPFSRNIDNELVYSQNEITNNKKNNFSTPGINKIIKTEKININNNIYFNPKIYYRTFKEENNKERNDIIMDNFNYINNKSKVNARNISKIKYSKSSIGNNKLKLNEIIKEIERLKLLKNNIENNNHKDIMQVYEYKNK